MATTGDLANLSNDVYRDSGAPTGWTRLEPFSGSGGFFGAVYQNANGEIFAVMRGMEASFLDAGAVGQVTLGIKPPAFGEASRFFGFVKGFYGNTVTFVGHSLGGAMVDYIRVVGSRLVIICCEDYRCAAKPRSRAVSIFMSGSRRAQETIAQAMPFLPGC
jgi:hypothetical protein